MAVPSASFLFWSPLLSTILLWSKSLLFILYKPRLFQLFNIQQHLFTSRFRVWRASSVPGSRGWGINSMSSEIHWQPHYWALCISLWVESLDLRKKFAPPISCHFSPNNVGLLYFPCVPGVYMWFWAQTGLLEVRAAWKMSWSSFFSPLIFMQ